jgi:hypothetical protein
MGNDKFYTCAKARRAKWAQEARRQGIDYYFSKADAKRYYQLMERWWTLRTSRSRREEAELEALTDRLRGP